jgi:hypothetical protein
LQHSKKATLESGGLKVVAAEGTDHQKNMKTMCIVLSYMENKQQSTKLFIRNWPDLAMKNKS